MRHRKAKNVPSQTAALMLYVVHPQQLFTSEGGDEREPADFLLSLLLAQAMPVCSSNILEGGKAPGQILSYPIEQFP